MKEFEKIEKLLKTKSYDQLTEDEKRLIDSELSQETYGELRLGMTQLAGERIKVNKDVKSSLLAEMKQGSERSFSPLQFKLPAYTHLIPLAIICYILFFMPEKERIITNDRIVEVQVHDTVLVNRTDTLWVERVVKVPTIVYVTQNETQPPSETDPIEKPTNRSLSDQKDVIDLVIRGTE